VKIFWYSIDYLTTTYHGEILMGQEGKEDANWVGIFTEGYGDSIDKERDDDSTTRALKAHGDKLVRQTRVLG
jgi:hypothetical protein